MERAAGDELVNIFPAVGAGRHRRIGKPLNDLVDALASFALVLVNRHENSGRKLRNAGKKIKERGYFSRL
jgi:hypothetical protein